MLHATRAIVLSSVKYRDTSLVVTMFTEELGLRGYVVNGVRSTQAKGAKAALYQPLTLLDIVAYERPHAELNRLKECRIWQAYQTIPFDFRKTCIAMYLSELLYRVLRTTESDPTLFGFLTDSLCWLDTAPQGYENFHLQFTLKLTEHLGFSPGSYDQLSQQLKEDHFGPVVGAAVTQLLHEDYGSRPPLHGKLRGELLEMLVRYYHLHLEQFPALRSIEVLRELSS